MAELLTQHATWPTKVVPHGNSTQAWPDIDRWFTTIDRWLTGGPAVVDWWLTGGPEVWDKLDSWRLARASFVGSELVRWLARIPEPTKYLLEGHVEVCDWRIWGITDYHLLSSEERLPKQMIGIY
ncbi:hypothetical protein Tco_0610263 [Tanacetum coccineum]